MSNSSSSSSGSLSSIWTFAKARAKLKAYFLPPSLIEEASRRLGYASFGLGSLILLGSIGECCYSQFSHQPLDLWLELPPMVFLFLFSTFVYYLTRRLEPAQSLNLGRFYLIVVCFVLAYADWMPGQSVFEWTPGTLDMADWKATGPSWVAVAVLCFTLILPARPRETLLLAVVATSTSPLAWLISRNLYTSQPANSELLVFFILQYVVCLMAWAQSFVFVRFISNLEAPSRVGPYKLVGLLGAGGMGQVWKARHALLARYAAVKLIRPEALAGTPEQQAEAIARFRREARITAALTSPHTVALFDYGQSDEGRLFSVTELLEGMDLGKMLELHGALPVGRCIYILRQICRSLEEAHSAGLVHRDIKPGNVFVCQVGMQHDFVKVLDFGLVFLTPQARAGERMGSEDEGDDTVPFHGTIDYMAPEQIQGRELDARSDIYSLGCLAFYMLTGTKVFEGNHISVLSGHLSKEPDLLAWRTDMFIPVEIEDLVLLCLRKNVDERPLDATCIRQQLEAMQQAYPWGDEQAGAWWKEQEAA